MITRRAALRGVAGGTAAVAAGGVLAACGGGGEEPAGAEASVAPRKGGKLRAAFIGGSTESTDPTLAAGVGIDYVRARVVWDTLGELDGGKPVWRLAEVVEPDSDATTWTVRVRKGVTFSDGRQLTATDVLFSLRTLVDKRSPQSGFMTHLDLRKARARDARTVELPLTMADGFFDLALAHSMFVFPDGTKNLAKAPGSGPYVLKQWQAGRGSVLVPREDYWDRAHGGPYLDELELVSVTDAAARLSGLKSGQFHYAGGLALTAVRTERGNSAVRVETPPKDLWVDLDLPMNLGLKPFTDARVVRAVKLALDRESLVRTVTLGQGEAGNDLVGAHQPYYATGIAQTAYDPERAAGLLKEAGHEGLAVSIRTSDYDYGTEESATAMVPMLAKAGIKATLDKVPAADYYSDFKTILSTPIQTSAYHPNPLPLMIRTYYGSTAAYPLTGTKGAQALDPLIAAMNRATRDDQRRARVADVQEHLHEHGGDALFARVPTVSGAAAKAHGVKARGYADYPSLRDAFLA
ncbi:ABC transporter substrate-binding protein [Streptomyces afghaniensis]|uniref:ABC transporter substrate-binding protein n=1 Tax=Streptomyces afghaniensis TaxID=66865 RepID=UPI0027809759|nr:ABC transporter substrate-binding protein [Streptomyces afghaniensis]MDQ1021161.1 peptide/nickel transport system substrate-binding protein [Streptomyces afghaniensis]